MLSALRRRLHVSPTTVIATFALVFAMSGGAYAAKKYLITSTKQISPSVLKQLQGKNGANGAAGAAGVQGAQGSAGPAGSAGAKGDTGAAGKDGSKGATGNEGLEGPEGPAGSEGSPWTDKGTLPSKATETGRWTADGPIEVSDSVTPASVSFPIPLAAPLDFEHVRVFLPALGHEIAQAASGEYESVTPTKCTGTEEAPTAAPGYLCIYIGEIAGMLQGFPTILKTGSLTSGIGNNTNHGAATSGATLYFSSINEPEVQSLAIGSFAVTAP